MLGYDLFIEKLMMLELEKQNLVIGKIFNNQVLLYDLKKNNDKVYLRYYDGNIYYQFCFLFNDKVGKMVRLKINNRIIMCDILVDSLLEKLGYIVDEKNRFYWFLKLLKEGNIKYFVYFL